MNPSREIAVGDIHGRVDALEMLLEKIDPSQSDSLIFLGDYIDRAPWSAEVMDLVMKLDRVRGERDIFLIGNHEEMLLQYAGKLKSVGDRTAWLYVGGDQVLEQWGGSIPPDVLDWIERRLINRYRTDNAYYVHGGFRPGPDFYEATTDIECRWLRTEFVRSTYSYPKPVIVGHTTVDYVPGGYLGGGPVIVPHRNIVFLDCKAFQTGVLAAYDVLTGTPIVVNAGYLK